MADPDALVRRRALEAPARMGHTDADEPGLVPAMVDALGDADRLVRYAAREAILRYEPSAWRNAVTATLDRPGHGTFEGTLALVFHEDPEGVGAALELLRGVRPETIRPDALGSYLRTLELALVRDRRPKPRRAIRDGAGAELLAIYPTGRAEIDRKLERLLAYLRPAGAIDALLAALEKEPEQEAQIAIAYALRAIPKGWSREQRQRFVSWFDDAREMRGAASMAGYIDAIWDDTLEILPRRERRAAIEGRERDELERAQRAAALLDASAAEIEAATEGPGLTQMSFDELAEYLEYDVMTYERYTPERGEIVFQQARCASCHVFGDLGRGGGPDLSTVIRRFRRSEILESIMYPSKVISDQYTAVDVETRDGSFHSGMVVTDEPDELGLITANGERVTLDPADVASREPSRVSLMPEGLLDAMTLSDLMSLFRFLEAGSDL